MSSIHCQRCDTRNPDRAQVCQGCGQPLHTGTMVMGTQPSVRRPRVSVRVVRADGGPEALIPMKSEVLTCGRAADLSVPDDPFLAEVQARFFFSGDKLAVEDLGGGNGLFIRLRHERQLPIGGEVRVGRQRLTLETIPPLAQNAQELAWGSPDPGYRFRLVQMLEGGITGNAYPLREGENHIGRDVGDLTFPSDGFVSGRHALIRVTGDQVWVKDLGSSNGTFIRLTVPAFVDTGEQFLVGRQLLRVELQP